MSNLLPQATTPIVAPMSSAGPVFYEDSFESDKFSIYQLLNLSAMRQQQSLQERQGYFEELVRLLESNLTALQPMAFQWEVKGQTYESTSLLFELYMTTVALGEELLRNQTYYKEAHATFLHAEAILASWKTSELVYPACPYVCTGEYVKNMMLITKGSQLLHDLRSGDRRGVALSSAMKFNGQVSFHLPEWSDVALNHYLSSRALLYFDLSQKDKENVDQGDRANASYTAAKEALEICRLIDRSKCHMNEALDNELNRVLEEAPEHMQSMQQVFYAVDAPLQNIKIPASLKNDSVQARES